MKISYHLPGLFEFYDLYKVFLPLFREHKEYFYDWCDIGSIYGAPLDCIWGGGRVELGNQDPLEVLELTNKHNISARLTLSNSLLNEEHLKDRKCNLLCECFTNSAIANGAIVHSDLLVKHLKDNFPDLYLISSTTKVITHFEELLREINREDFKYVVPDFRLNKDFGNLDLLTQAQKDKVEFLINECCYFGCQERKKCYENVSQKNLGMDVPDHVCHAPESNSGYMFSKAMKNPGFIGLDDIKNTYLPKGFSNYKIEGRGLGSALLLEFILYYMVKPEYHINVREMLYLDNTLDLF